MDATVERRGHGGALHVVRSKDELAAHIGEPHVLPDGSTHRVVSPDARRLARWSRQELEQTHAAMHEGVTK